MKLNTNDHILVAGGGGLLGRHLQPLLQRQYPIARITVVASKTDCDLADAAAAARLFSVTRPSIVIHLAALTGGIEVNRTRPADYLHVNLQLIENIFHESARHRVRKIIYPLCGCAYPRDTPSPMTESAFWHGLPEPTSIGYATAKLAGLTAARVYREQYGIDTAVPVPGNMYGEYDHFDPMTGHVIPALIRKFDRAAQDNAPIVQMWGSGAPIRDFVYAGDVAQCIPFFLENDIGPEPVNISGGQGVSIRDLAGMVARATGYRGAIDWDTTKPDGQPVKVFNVNKMQSLGMQCATPLETGLRKTVYWFRRYYQQKHQDE